MVDREEKTNEEVVSEEKPEDEEDAERLKSAFPGGAWERGSIANNK
jgi:hypothetical protein